VLAFIVAEKGPDGVTGESPVGVCILVGRSDAAVETGAGVAELPLVLLRGAPSLTQGIIAWIALAFDAHVSVYKPNAVDLDRFLAEFAVWTRGMGLGPETKPLELVFCAPIAADGLGSIAVTLPAVEVMSLRGKITESCRGEGPPSHGAVNEMLVRVL
jgi:kinetochore complex Sim4 subunit Fta1